MFKKRVIAYLQSMDCVDSEMPSLRKVIMMVRQDSRPAYADSDVVKMFVDKYKDMHGIALSPSESGQAVCTRNMCQTLILFGEFCSEIGVDTCNFNVTVQSTYSGSKILFNSIK